LKSSLPLSISGILKTLTMLKPVLSENGNTICVCVAVLLQTLSEIAHLNTQLAIFRAQSFSLLAGAVTSFLLDTHLEEIERFPTPAVIGIVSGPGMTHLSGVPSPWQFMDIPQTLIAGTLTMCLRFSIQWLSEKWGDYPPFL
jgi:hypothetical protein